MPRRHSLSISSDAADQTRPLSTRYRYTTATVQQQILSKCCPAHMQHFLCMLIFKFVNFGLVCKDMMSMSMSCPWAAFVWDLTFMLTVRCGGMCKRINSIEQQKTVK